MARKQPPTILTATLSDLDYVEAEARCHSNNIGFVPRSALADHIQRGNVSLLEINGQNAGYMLSGGGKLRPYRLIQVAITPELWRLGYGSHLIAYARRTASTRPISTMTATIRDGLPMICVAETTGAHRTATHNRQTARKTPTHDYLWPAILPLVTTKNCQSVVDLLARPPETHGDASLARSR